MNIPVTYIETHHGAVMTDTGLRIINITGWPVLWPELDDYRT